MSTLPKKTLDQLPPEIISHIVSHAPTANFLRNLSLTSRSLYQVVEADGWNAFVTNRFPSFSVPPYWRDAAHSLTTLSRNFDRRAFIAQDLGPDLGPDCTFIRELPGGGISKQWKRTLTRQTMGYQPVIDSHEVWNGNTWADRREIVAWGAGAEVVVHMVQRGSPKLPLGCNDSSEERRYNRSFDPTGSSNRMCLAHRRPQDLEGRDDITSINLVNSTARQSSADDSESISDNVDVIVGRASGGLERLRLWSEGSQCKKTFDSGNLTIRSADVTSTSRPLLGACIGDSKIALYSVSGDDQHVLPLSETNCLAGTEAGSRSWSARFLSDDKLAVGRGISSRIVHVYMVRPDGISQHPIRSFGSCGGEGRGVKTSAYPIVPAPDSSQDNALPGQLFFSGGHDGIIRLHDMRSSQDCQATIADPVDRSAIFSLATVGRERLIAGAAAHSLLKVFDLRMTGGRTYCYQHVADPGYTDMQSLRLTAGRDVECYGWNAFTMIFNMSGMRRSRMESPIYSLSRPSQSSTSLYVGAENTVSHFNLTSVSDQHPDPIFSKSIIRTSNGRVDAKKTWNERGMAVPLNIYERTGEAEARLLTQKYDRLKANIDKRDDKIDSRLAGYDESWYLV